MRRDDADVIDKIGRSSRTNEIGPRLAIDVRILARENCVLIKLRLLHCRKRQDQACGLDQSPHTRMWFMEKRVNRNRRRTLDARTPLPINPRRLMDWWMSDP